MSDLESVSSSDEEIPMHMGGSKPEPVPEPEKPKRKGRGKNKPETVEKLLKEEIIDAKPIRGRAKKTIKKKMEAAEEVEPFTQVTKEGAEDFKKKSTRKKKEPVPAPEPEPAPAPAKPEKKKRVYTEEQREKMIANLAKGRETRAANMKRKREERAKFVEDLKVKIAEPVVKETIIKEVPASVQRNGRAASAMVKTAPVQAKQSLRFV
tara:strand:- start:2748 stop:3371 length:624 start_codon:yes stop_codon:yes gene_type:complete